MSTDEGFLTRWSRRKTAARAGLPVPAEEPACPNPAAGPTMPVADDGQPAAPSMPSAPSAPDEDGQPLPTLQDVERLTPESDFRPFVRPQVAPEVRNAALRRLFSDPHFNQMDGLDVYIDDYSQPNPLPAELARRMVAAQFMRLFDEPKANAATAPAGPAAAGAMPEGAATAPAGDARPEPSEPAAAASTGAIAVDPSAADPDAAAVHPMPTPAATTMAPRPELSP
ncbi:MAG: DUF3306 domain-containing protein [Tepidimonas sp.]|uniref:DUF3306 domain-containing protein n=1 Tax=Tepidimonas sp. TaxID=2002775 RepID=UPI00298F3AA0|nr:DUF3306 domain-containing protein [Tepidimonas sp.]MCS6809972.1 DUF3306 domain-containing protein [Tepidimonas sp.]MCX7741868.1 DUF3306 domain-containing protein [Tepidimonas sp.]MDW8335436.1 DUF3306 domain-containing protein [Tepidimonas sp.]